MLFGTNPLAAAFYSFFSCSKTHADDEAISGKGMESKNKMTISAKEYAITGTLIVEVMALIAVGAILMKMGYFDKIFNMINSLSNKDIIVLGTCAGMVEVGLTALGITFAYHVALKGYEPAEKKENSIGEEGWVMIDE